MQDNFGCEFEHLKILTPPGGHWRGYYEPHHVGRIRVDRIECVLSLCHGCHSYGHERDRKFLIWSLYAKHLKGELNFSVLDELTRGKRLLYLVRDVRDEVRKEGDERTATMADTLLERYGNGEF